MSRPKIDKLSGPTYAYLGHFRQERYVREGHNTNSWDSLPEPARTQEWARSVTKGRQRRIKNEEVEEELRDVSKKDARLARKLDLNKEDIRSFKRFKAQHGGSLREYDRLMRNQE